MTWRTGREGFSVDFPNGWTASVVWGGGTYSSNYHESPFDTPSLPKAKVVEVGVWRTENPRIWIDEHMVRGWLDHEEVLSLMMIVINLPNSDESGYNTKEIHRPTKMTKEILPNTISSEGE